MCEECGRLYEEQEFTVADLYKYNARPQMSYHKLYHFNEVVGQFQGRQGKQIPPESLHQIRSEFHICSEATAIDVKTAKLKLTKYMENLYCILFAVTGKKPPYRKREVEDEIVRMFKMIDRVRQSIERDRRRSFPNYYYILIKLVELMGQTETVATSTFASNPFALTSARLHLEGVRRARVDAGTNRHSLREPIS